MRQSMLDESSSINNSQSNMSNDEEKKIVVEVGEPKKVMSWEEFYSPEKSDNANKLMDRVWYAIACSDKAVAEQKVFWEHWYWKEGRGSGGPDDEKPLELKKKKKGCNHTLTIEAKDGNKEIDYPIWPLSLTKESLKMYPAIDLKCFTIAPMGISMQPLMFPTNDNHSEFRVDYAKVMGKKMYFVFTLDPHISEESKNEQFSKLDTEFGVKREWFHMVQWDKSYVIGSTGDPDINPK
mmetsp:Transcript_2092/g.2310  ORF Transcript_2092/g.2310 Transcript_2092/m.2310 type:complete len:237 (-) Transcript_2092:431-1141(-)